MDVAEGDDNFSLVARDPSLWDEDCEETPPRDPTDGVTTTFGTAEAKAKAKARAIKASPKAKARATKVSPKAKARVTKVSPKAKAKATKVSPKAKGKATKASPKAKGKARKSTGESARSTPSPQQPPARKRKTSQQDAKGDEQPPTAPPATKPKRRESLPAFSFCELVAYWSRGAVAIKIPTGTGVSGKAQARSRMLSFGCTMYYISLAH